MGDAEHWKRKYDQVKIECERVTVECNRRSVMCHNLRLKVDQQEKLLKDAAALNATYQRYQSIVSEIFELIQRGMADEIDSSLQEPIAEEPVAGVSLEDGENAAATMAEEPPQDAENVAEPIAEEPVQNGDNDEEPVQNAGNDEIENANGSKPSNDEMDASSTNVVSADQYYENEEIRESIQSQTQEGDAAVDLEEKSDDVAPETSSMNMEIVSEDAAPDVNVEEAENTAPESYLSFNTGGILDYEAPENFMSFDMEAQSGRETEEDYSCKDINSQPLISSNQVSNYVWSSAFDEELGDLMIDEDSGHEANEEVLEERNSLANEEVLEERTSLANEEVLTEKIVEASNGPIDEQMPVEEAPVLETPRISDHLNGEHSNTSPDIAEGHATKKRALLDASVQGSSTRSPAETPAKRPRTSKITHQNRLSTIIEMPSPCQDHGKSLKLPGPYLEIMNSMLPGSETTHDVAFNKLMQRRKYAPESMAAGFIGTVKRDIISSWNSLDSEQRDRQKTPPEDQKLLHLLVDLTQSSVKKWRKLPEIVMDELGRQLISKKNGATKREALFRWAFQLCRYQSSRKFFNSAKELILCVLQRDTPPPGDWHYDNLLSTFLNLAMVWPMAFKKLVVDGDHDLVRIIGAIFRSVIGRSSMKRKAEQFLEHYLGKLCDVKNLINGQQQLSVEFLLREQLDILSQGQCGLEFGLTDSGVRLPEKLSHCLYKLSLLAPYCDDQELETCMEQYVLILTNLQSEPNSDADWKKVISYLILLARLSPFCHQLLFRYVDEITNSLNGIISGGHDQLFNSDRPVFIYACVELATALSLSGILKETSFMESLNEEFNEEKADDAAWEYYQKRFGQLKIKVV